MTNTIHKCSTKEEYEAMANAYVADYYLDDDFEIGLESVAEEYDKLYGMPDGWYWLD